MSAWYAKARIRIASYLACVVAAFVAVNFTSFAPIMHAFACAVSACDANAHISTHAMRAHGLTHICPMIKAEHDEGKTYHISFRLPFSYCSGVSCPYSITCSKSYKKLNIYLCKYIDFLPPTEFIFNSTKETLHWATALLMFWRQQRGNQRKSPEHRFSHFLKPWHNRHVDLFIMTVICGFCMKRNGRIINCVIDMIPLERGKITMTVVPPKYFQLRLNMLSYVSVAVCLRCLLHYILSLIAYTFRENRDLVFIIIVQFMMSSNSRIRFG